jgi:hypothetical protein
MKNKQMKLGKLKPIHKDSISFGDFLTVPPIYPLVDTPPNFIYPMDLNDSIGDCVVAGFDHSRQIITGLLTGTQKNFTIDEIKAFYATQNPNGTDNGMSMQLFLEYLVTNKYIVGFASVNWKNEDELKSAIYLGLGIMTGVQLQQAQEQQFGNNQTWDSVVGSPIIGGHCIPASGFLTPANEYSIITWGKQIQTTKNFVANQMDEAWFILMQEHIDHPNFRNHFDLQGFSDAVKAITQGKIVIPVPIIISTNPVLKIGSKGDAVKTLQTKLNTVMGSNLIVDGVFGPMTADLVGKFQSKNGLVVDKVVGPMTWAALNAPLVKSKLDLWCEATKQMENSNPRLNNPGDLEFHNQPNSILDPVGKRFALFNTYQDGLTALKSLLKDACMGKRNPTYNQNGNLYDFYNVYAPSSDNNNPKQYAEFVANYIGVSPLIIISTLV